MSYYIFKLQILKSLGLVLGLSRILMLVELFSITKLALSGNVLLHVIIDLENVMFILNLFSTSSSKL